MILFIIFFIFYHLATDQKRTVIYPNGANREGQVITGLAGTPTNDFVSIFEVTEKIIFVI